MIEDKQKILLLSPSQFIKLKSYCTINSYLNNGSEGIFKYFQVKVAMLCF